MTYQTSEILYGVDDSTIERPKRHPQHLAPCHVFCPSYSGFSVVYTEMNQSTYLILFSLVGSSMRKGTEVDVPGLEKSSWWSWKPSRYSLSRVPWNQWDIDGNTVLWARHWPQTYSSPVEVKAPIDLLEGYWYRPKKPVCFIPASCS